MPCGLGWVLHLTTPTLLHWTPLLWTLTYLAIAIYMCTKIKVHMWFIDTISTLVTFGYWLVLVLMLKTAKYSRNSGICVYIYLYYMCIWMKLQDHTYCIHLQLLTSHVPLPLVEWTLRTMIKWPHCLTKPIPLLVHSQWPKFLYYQETQITPFKFHLNIADISQLFRVH